MTECRQRVESNRTSSDRRDLPSMTMAHLPLIDLRAAPDEVAKAIGDACRAHGFFYIVNHGIDECLGQRLEDLSHRFFALSESTKARYAMPLGGRAWRGWFA